MKILFAFLIVQSCLQLASSQQRCPEQELENGHTLGCSWDGGELQYFCNTGYTVSGPHSRVCVNGSWSGPQPSCQNSSNPFSFADARLDPVYEIFPKFYYAPTGFIPACWISLDLNDANFICRQIGLGEATSIHRVDVEYGIELNGPFAYADSVDCSGTDMHISECTIAGFQILKGCPDGILGMTCGPTTQLVYNSMLDRMQLSYRDTATDLCYNSVDQLTADTYCRLEGKLGGGVRRSVNGSKVGMSIIQELKCPPKMKNFDDCAFKKVDTNCSGKYLKIDCLETTVENSLRLVGSRDLHTGNLQIYKGGSWGDVCWEAFYSDEATVACRQLGFDDYLAYPRGVYGDRVGDSYKVERVRCDADAKNFSDCEFLPETRCNSPDETVSLWCIYYKDCCVPNITSNNLKSNSTANTFAHGSFLSYSCVGSTVLEGTNTLQCDSGVWSSDTPTCTPAKDNSVRLVDGSSPNEGTVQIFQGSEWHFVCDGNWLYSAATKVCEDIGYDGALQLTHFNYFKSNPGQPLYSLECPNRDNATLSDCSINSTNCSIEDAAGVICGNLQFKSRLFGDRITEGRAQIYFNGNWLDICSDFPLFFGNGYTICRTLGFTYNSQIPPTEGMLEYGPPTSTEIIEILCFSNNENFESCQHNFDSCGNPGVYIRCNAPANNSVRLVGGTNTFQGQVEIYRDYSWQGICSIGWDTVDGMVLCQQLGFPNVSSVSGSFGSIESYYGFAVSSVDCVGNETSIDVCPVQISTEMCGINDSAVVVCEINEQFQIRLRYSVGSERNISGLVEVFVGMEWLGVCDDDWGLPDVEVVCRSLGYDFAIEAITNYALIQAPQAWNRVNCVGNETNLGECGYTNTTVSTSFFASCYLTEGAGVTCGKYVEYDVRFREQTVIPPDNLRGVVEVLIGGGWYPICDSGLNISQYLCGELGLSQVTEFYSEPFSQLSDPISQSINDITCIDNGMSLMECQSTPGPVTDCASAMAIGVSCVELDGSIRLVDGNSTAGHVQILFNGEWGDVCDDFWGLPDADVVCRQLGQRGALSATLTSAFARRTANFLLDNVRCVGTESRLINCPSNEIGNHNCLNYELAGVYCIPEDCPMLPAPGNGTVFQDVEHLGFANFFCEGSYKLFGEERIQCLWSIWDGEVPECVTAQEGDVQLVDSGSSLEGHVQIFHNGQWGYVCDNGWGIADGEVVCTQLEYAPNVRGISISSFYPNLTNVSQIWLDDVQCSGSEEQLSKCLGADYAPHNCDGRELAGVECFADEGRLRLIEGTSDRNGLLQIYFNGTWHYFCYFTFSGLSQACSQLGFQTTGYTQAREINVTEMYSASCSSSDTYLYPHCDISDAPICFLNLAINLTCTVDDECRVRLSENSYKGVIEFWREGKWGGVCKDGINLETANIFCKQLGWPDGASSVSYDVINGGALPFHYQSVSCSPDQTDICNCTKDPVFTTKCTRDQALFVECILPMDGTLRLAGGNSDASGVLEIFHEERWGSVCDDFFKSASANVACRQLGFKDSKTVVLGRRILREFWLDDVQCDGSEQYLSNCSRKDWGIDNCGSSEGVLLECTPYVEGELALTHRVFTDRIITAGVQIRYNELWYNICPQSITDAFANQICTHFDLPDDVGVSGAIEMNRTVDSSPDSLSILSCPLDFENLTECLQSVNCSTDKVLGIRCSSFENQTRLITSTGYSGIIQINHELSWRGICDDGWDLNDATVACIQLGFTGALQPLSSIYGETDGFWLTNVDCTGDERYLDHCGFESWAVSNCLRFEFAGVVCEPNNCIGFPNISNGMFYGNTTHGSVIELDCGADYVENGGGTLSCIHGEWIGAIPSCVLAQELSLRLIGSDDFHQGYVQIYHNNTWGYICDTNWGDIEAETACIQLGFEALQSRTVQSFHGNRTGPIWSHYVQCEEGDRSFAECSINFTYSANCSLAGVICIELEGDVMLINGTNTSSEHSGWVQIYVQGSYHPVCSSGFGDEEIGVICRQLGFSKGQIVKFGDATYSYSDFRFNCNGDEDRISECREYELSGANCFRLGVFINCTFEDYGAFRLIDGAYGYEGILEIHLETEWSAVCHDMDLTQDTIDGICHILGWQYGGKSIMSNRSYSEVGVQVSITSCLVGAKNYSECQLNTSDSSCNRKNALFISCYPPPQNTLRRDIVNALEIFHGTRWGYVCDDFFDLPDAHVACYQLGYINATKFKTSVNVAHSFFWLDNLLCSGNEESLADCRSNNFGFENCYYGEGVTVDCVPYDEGEIRFFDGTDIPQIYNDNEFRYICAEDFSMQSADVICAQDGQFRAESFGSIGIESGQTKPSEFARKVSCTGSETNVINCDITDAPSCSSVSTVECIDPTGMIRLLGDSSVQVYSDGWKYICGDRWSSKDAEIVCTQLGSLNGVVDFYTLTPPSNVEYYGSRFDCYGTEKKLIECIHDKGNTCDTNNVAAATCTDLTCPYAARVIRCGSPCSAACYEDPYPIACGGCVEKCECIQGFIWNTTEQNICISKHDCPNLCTQNETYMCVPACQFDCSNYNDNLPIHCSRLYCSSGCGCKTGYVRKYGIAGECLLESDCPDMSSTTPTVATTPPPLNCPSNSQFTECGTACPANCSIPDTSEIMCTRQCVRSCECLDGYVLQGTECIKKENCPTPLNCPSNSQFTECGTACPGNCSSLDTSEITCTKQCVRSCQCLDGYVLQGMECIKKENCPTPLNCPENSQFTECGTACPANCSSLDTSGITCTKQCVRSCQCMDGYVWLGMECVRNDACPAEGEIIVQSSTSSTSNIMGPLQLFSGGGWYNICSDPTQKAEFHALAVEKCVSIDTQTDAVTLSETNSVTGIAMSLQCMDANSFNNCSYTLISNCDYILSLACMREPVISGGASTNVGVIAGVSASIVLAVLIFVILVIIALVVILLIRRKNRGKAYKQFDHKLSVASEYAEPGEEAPAITNPIYQIKELETDKLVTEDDSVIAD